MSTNQGNSGIQSGDPSSTFNEECSLEKSNNIASTSYAAPYFVRPLGDYFLNEDSYLKGTIPFSYGDVPSTSYATHSSDFGSQINCEFNSVPRFYIDGTFDDTSVANCDRDESSKRKGKSKVEDGHSKLEKLKVVRSKVPVAAANLNANSNYCAPDKSLHGDSKNSLVNEQVGPKSEIGCIEVPPAKPGKVGRSKAAAGKSKEKSPDDSPAESLQVEPKKRKTNVKGGLNQKRSKSCQLKYTVEESPAKRKGKSKVEDGHSKLEKLKGVRSKDPVAPANLNENSNYCALDKSLQGDSKNSLVNEQVGPNSEIGCIEVQPAKPRKVCRSKAAAGKSKEKSPDDSPAELLQVEPKKRKANVKGGLNQKISKSCQLKDTVEESPAKEILDPSCVNMKLVSQDQQGIMNVHPLARDVHFGQSSSNLNSFYRANQPAQLYQQNHPNFHSFSGFQNQNMSNQAFRPNVNQSHSHSGPDVLMFNDGHFHSWPNFNQSHSHSWPNVNQSHSHCGPDVNHGSLPSGANVTQGLVPNVCMTNCDYSRSCVINNGSLAAENANYCPHDRSYIPYNSTHVAQNGPCTNHNGSLIGQSSALIGQNRALVHQNLTRNAHNCHCVSYNGPLTHHNCPVVSEKRHLNAHSSSYVAHMFGNGLFPDHLPNQAVMGNGFQRHHQSQIPYEMARVGAELDLQFPSCNGNWTSYHQNNSNGLN